MDDVENIKSKVDLVEVISSYLPLKKAGRNFAALCPFHSEKTPSFMVSPDRQVFKCFGCGEAGDVLTFLEKMEGWDFRETLEELAKRVGIKLTSYAPTTRSKVREKLLAINSLVMKFYGHLLNKHPSGTKAREYLTKRGIKKSLWEKFDLGYAPGGWENTLNFLIKRGFALEDVATAGLIIAQETRKSYYDRFRERLIFPLKDSRGAILGFAGRIIESSKEPRLPAPQVFDPEAQTRRAQASGGQAKYINSPETPIFNKGSLLFGLDVAKKAIREKNETLLVEGEFDVLSSHLAGIENVVASKGTALTDKQVATIARLCENVSLCFDMDLAGDVAARRGIELLDLTGVTVRVVSLGKYKDPDELAQKDPKGFQKAIHQAVNVYDYLMESAIARYNPEDVDGKKRIGKEIIPVLSKISDDVVRAHYIGKLAGILSLEVGLVASAVEKKSSDLYVVDPEKSTGRSPVSAISSEQYFLALLVSQDEIESSFCALLLPEDFKIEEAKLFWKWLRDIIKISKTKSLATVLKKLPKYLKEFVDNLYLINISPTLGEKESWAVEMVKVAKRVKRASLASQLSEISKLLKAAQEQSDRIQIAHLTKRFDQISINLKEAM